MISGGVISRAAMWPKDSYNNPGAGLVVESSRKGPDATVVVDGVEFSSNRLKDLQLSKGAINCLVKNNSFTNIVTMRPFQRGGHVVRSNVFSGDAKVVLSKASADNMPVTIKDNVYECVKDKFIKRRHGRLPENGVEQSVIVDNNSRKVG